MMLRRILTNTAAAVIGLVSGLHPGFSAYALPFSTKYISDIRTVCAMSASEAEAKFKAEGYTMLKTDVNPTLNKSVYIGYKTSTDVNDAIRGLHYMNMAGKYSFSDYEQILKDHRAIVDDNIEGLVPTIQAYRDAYAKGTENALHAYEMLNHVFDFISGEYMGDFLLNCPLEKGSRDALTDAFMKGNSAIIMQVQRLLTLAGTTENSCWLERFESTSLQDLTEEFTSAYYSANRAQKAMAQEYFADASVLLSQYWDDLYNSILNVEKNVTKDENGDYDVTAVVDDLVEDYNLPTDEDLGGASDEEVEKQVKKVLDTDEKNLDFGVDYVSRVAGAQESIDAYEVLNMYEYNGKPMLDFFRRPSTEVTVEELYPLVASLSAAERGTCKTVGLGNLILNAGADDHWNADREDAFKIWADNSGTVSLYYNVNLKAYENGVALTSAAASRDKTNSFWKHWWELFTNPSKGTNLEERMVQPLTFLQLGGVCFITFAVVTVVRKVVRAYIKSHYPGVFVAARGTTTVGTLKLITTSNQQAIANRINPFTDPFKYYEYTVGSTTQAGTISGFLYRTLFLTTLVLYVVMVISVILAGITAFLSLWHTATYSKIPVAICDAWMGGSFTDYILYEAAEGLDKSNMEYADMNGYVEKYGGIIEEASVGWLVLYYTKDENAGDPITELKLVSGSDGVSPAFEGVSIFGEGTVTNLTDEKYTGQSENPNIRLYCKRKNVSASGTAVTGGVYAVVGGFSLAAGGAIGALLGGRRRKKAVPQAAAASD